MKTVWAGRLADECSLFDVLTNLLLLLWLVLLLLHVFVVFFWYGLNLYGECAILHLILPLFNPGIWTNVMEHLLEVFAWFVVGAANLLASIEIDERLSAVTCLIGIWISWIEWSTERQQLLLLLLCQVIEFGFSACNTFHFDAGLVLCCN